MIGEDRKGVIMMTMPMKRMSNKKWSLFNKLVCLSVTKNDHFSNKQSVCNQSVCRKHKTIKNLYVFMKNDDFKKNCFSVIRTTDLEKKSKIQQHVFQQWYRIPAGAGSSKWDIENTPEGRQGPISVSEWLLGSFVLIMYLSNSTNIHKYWDANAVYQ